MWGNKVIVKVRTTEGINEVRKMKKQDKSMQEWRENESSRWEDRWAS